MVETITVLPQYPRPLIDLTQDEFLEFFGFMKDNIVNDQFEFIEVRGHGDNSMCTYAFKWVDKELNNNDVWSYNEFGINLKNGAFTVKDMNFLVSKGFVEPFVYSK